MQGHRFRERLYYAVILAICFGVSHVSHAQSGNDWYHPEPPSLPDKNTPLILPITTERPVVPVPAKTLTLAVSRLTHTAIVPLTADLWADLRITWSPDQLLARVIEQKQRPKVYRTSMVPFGPVELSWSRRPEEISHWRSLKDRGLKPYLVRAVATSGDESEFMADVWRDALTITHFSAVEGNLANDPLRQHASIIFNPENVRSTKSPVIVYLEHEPNSVFTELMVKAGY